MGRFGLYKRISPLGDPKISIVPVLDEWRGEGNYTSKEELRGMIKELTKYKRFVHALEVIYPFFRDINISTLFFEELCTSMNKSLAIL